MEKLKRIKIFVSSPGDVSEERVITERVIERLRKRFSGYGSIEPIFWEHEPLLATSDYQSQLPLPSETDITVCILWSRLGTRLPENITRSDGSRYESGTEFEFECALESYKKTERPELLTYYKTAEPKFLGLDEQARNGALEQLNTLKNFMQKWFKDETGESYVSAYHEFAGLDEFEKKLEIHLKKRVEQLLECEPDERTGPPVWDEGSPFRGLESFRREHEAIFFGRTKAISEVLSSLRQQSAAGSSFVMIVGASGSGKSSLVKAGVLPILTAPGVVEGVSQWRILEMRLDGEGGDSPFEILAKKLLSPTVIPEVSTSGFDEDRLVNEFQTAPEKAVAAIGSILSNLGQSSSVGNTNLVVFVDQFEELFKSEITVEMRDAFCGALAALAAHGGIYILVTLRSDFYEQCQSIKSLLDLKSGYGQYDLVPPSLPEIEDMVRRPAIASGLVYEHNLETGERLDSILCDTADNSPQDLALLQFTLQELYFRCEGNKLSLAAYYEIGGMEGALASRAEAEFKALPNDVQKAFHSVFFMLVTISPGERDKVRRRYLATHELAGESKELIFVHAFVNARLFTAEGSDLGQVVTVSHEALFRHWPRLAEWVEQYIERLQSRTRVEASMAHWVENHEIDDLLLSPGKQLADAIELHVTEKDNLGDKVIEYIKLSVEKDKQAERVKMRWIAAVIVTLICLLIFSSFKWRDATLYAKEADEKAKLAEKNEEYAHNQTLLVNENARREKEQRKIAEENAIESEKQTKQAEENLKLYKEQQEQTKKERNEKDVQQKYAVANATSLKKSWSTYYMQKALLNYEQRDLRSAINNFTNSLRYSYNLGSKIGLEISKYEVPERLFSVYLNLDVVAMEYSPDNQVVAIATSDTVYFLDANSGRRVLTVTGHSNIQNIKFHPSGLYLYMKEKGNKILRRIGVYDQKAIKCRLAQSSIGMMFADNGDTLIVGTAKGLNIYNASSLKLIESYLFDKSALSADVLYDKTIAVVFQNSSSQSSSINEVIFYRYENKKITMENRSFLTTDPQKIIGGVSDDCSYITVDNFGSIYMHKYSNSYTVVAGKHKGKVLDCKLSNNGKKMVAKSTDGDIYLWKIGQQLQDYSNGYRNDFVKINSYPGEFVAACISPDGHRLVTIGDRLVTTEDREVVFWNVADKAFKKIKTREDNYYFAKKFSFLENGQYGVIYKTDPIDIINFRLSQGNRLKFLKEKVYSAIDVIDADLKRQELVKKILYSTKVGMNNDATCFFYLGKEFFNLLNIETGKERKLLKTNIVCELFDAMFSNKHGYFACHLLYYDKKNDLPANIIRVINYKENRLLDIQHETFSRHACIFNFSQDDKYFAILDKNYAELTIWDLAENKQVKKIGIGNLEISSLAFSHDNSRIALGVDYGIKILNLNTMSVSKTLLGLNQPSKIYFNSDSTVIYANNKFSTCIWTMDNWAEICHFLINTPAAAVDAPGAKIAFKHGSTFEVWNLAKDVDK